MTININKDVTITLEGLKGHNQSQWKVITEVCTPVLRKILSRKIKHAAERQGYSGSVELDDAVQYVWLKYWEWLNTKATNSEGLMSALYNMAGMEATHYVTKYLTPNYASKSQKDLGSYAYYDLAQMEGHKQGGSHSSKPAGTTISEYSECLTPEKLAADTELLDAVKRIVVKEGAIRYELFNRVMLDGETYEEVCSDMRLQPQLARKVIERMKHNIIKVLGHEYHS